MSGFAKLARTTLGVVGVSPIPGAIRAVRAATEIEQAEQYLRCLTPEVDVPAVLAEVARREATWVPVPFPHPVTGEPEWHSEPLGRLRALRETYRDYSTGEWKP